MIRLPWFPPELAPNARPHFMAKAKAAKKARSWGAIAAREARAAVAAGDVPVLLHITFYPPSRRHNDRDNLLASVKWMLDGIADHLGVDDKLFRPTVHVGPVRKGGEITVTLAPPTVAE